MKGFHRREFIKAGAGGGAAQACEPVCEAWIAAPGSAEAFTFGPVIGKYVAQRVVSDGDSALARGFPRPATPLPTLSSR